MRSYVTRSKPPLALLEVLDRDGHTRHQMKIMRWPLTIGRGLDNDWVLDDAHTALRHLTLEADDMALKIQVGDTINGAVIEGRLVSKNSAVSSFAPVTLIKVGETTLRIRMANHILPVETPLEDMPRVMRGWPVLVVLILACAGALAFHSWLTNDPDDWLTALGSESISSLYLVGGWCAFWALLSKVITRRAQVGWHLRVTLLAVLVWLVARALPGLLAFAWSWPWISSFGFVLPASVLALAVYHHLRKVETKHPIRRKGLAALVLVALIGTNLWSNQQSNVKRWGDEVYMGQIYPPAFRLANAHSLDDFMGHVRHLQDQFAVDAAEPLPEEPASDLGDQLP